MIKDNRYNIARIFIEKGEIKTIAQIFDYIPKSVVSHEIRTNNNRFTRLINDPLEFKLIVCRHESVVALSHLPIFVVSIK